MINRRLLEPQCKVQRFIIFNQSSQCLKSVCYMTDYFPHLKTSLSLARITSVYYNFMPHILSFGHIFLWIHQIAMTK